MLVNQLCRLCCLAWVPFEDACLSRWRGFFFDFDAAPQGSDLELAAFICSCPSLAARACLNPRIAIRYLCWYMHAEGFVPTCNQLQQTSNDSRSAKVSQEPAVLGKSSRKELVSHVCTNIRLRRPQPDTYVLGCYMKGSHPQPGWGREALQDSDDRLLYSYQAKAAHVWGT